MITHDLLPGWWFWVAHFLIAALLVVAILRAPWERLADREQLHVYLGACVGLMVLWTLKASVNPGLSFHFLGATLFTLMFGWELSILGFGLVLLGTGINLGGDWSTFSVNLIFKGGVPILASAVLLNLAQRRLPAQVFVYIFVNGFFGAAIAILVDILAIAALLAGAGAYSMEYLGSEYLAFSPLMMFSEAWITGMFIAIFVGFRPAWLNTFDDDVYLRGRKRPS